MVNFREIPTPKYDYEVSLLVGYYEKALNDLRAELSRVDLTKFERAQTRATLNNVKAILKDLDKSALGWVERYIPQAVSDGITRTLIALGIATSLSEAEKIMKFNRLNQDLIKTAVADTQSDLLQITQNVDRKVRIAVREVTAEVMRSNLTQGVNATATLKREIVQELRARLGDSLNTGIIDASNRRWKPQVYAEMVVRTKMASAQREAAINDGISRDALYGVISRHNAIDACKFYEGKIVKLTRDADGDYPYIGDLPRREIFHPNCRHVVTPVRRLDTLPDVLREINGM
ncbi:phage minor capsid protein [Robertmurraya andreesenii]|uniref:Minor capsid protein n=1 Tax=Anoxybacillus andreesenii TaxID=1325932 RepID=A0ABT9V1W3_9BACL|nr:phage minor capsid protein [Robertmurraya andreesenii]MDQ0154919.1 hypothetical protein [Robertmurraya andreesenii]